MNHFYLAKFNNIELLPLRYSDIETLRIWRNDKKQIKFLRNIGHISADAQRQWFESYLNDENEMIFGIHDLELKCLVGSLSLYAVDWDSRIASIGKIQIGDEREHGKGIGRLSLVMAMKIGFRFLKLEKIIGSVHPDNIQAYTNDMKVGFRVVGQRDSTVGGKEDLLEITEEEAGKVNDYYPQIEVEDTSKTKNEFYIGKEGKFSKTITEFDIYGFAGITGDFNPVHIDRVESKKSIFGQQVAHGMLVSSLFSTVIGTLMPGAGSIYLSQSSRFLKPVYIGDTITVYVSIKEIGDKGRARLRTDAYNQDSIQVISGDALVVLPERGEKNAGYE